MAKSSTGAEREREKAMSEGIGGTYGPELNPALGPDEEGMFELPIRKTQTSVAGMYQPKDNAAIRCDLPDDEHVWTTKLMPEEDHPQLVLCYDEDGECSVWDKEEQDIAFIGTQEQCEQYIKEEGN